MSRIQKTLAFLTIAIVCITIPSGLIYAQAAEGPSGLLHSKKPVPNKYIVVLKEPAQDNEAPGLDVASAARELTDQYSGELGHTYHHALHGFSATMPEGRALALAHDPRVAYVEEATEISLETTQVNPPWGLDRIDRHQGLNFSYDYINTGAGVNVYVIDSGILTWHSDFMLRAANLGDFVGDGHGAMDCFGHGTWVAGIIGGNAYGVAKGVSLYGLRVFDCQGSSDSSMVIAAVDWLTGHRILPAVANMSLGSPPDEALDAAVRNSIASGITYVVAAGNQGTDAINRSPARVAEAITVAATDASDTKPGWSNYGTLVDVFAPGVDITSDWYTGPNATLTDSGTSASSPHVAGVAALYLQNHTTATPAMVSDMIKSQATQNVVIGPGPGSPNALLYVTYGTGASITIAGREQHACKVDTSICGGIIYDSGWVSATVNGRTYKVTYGRLSTPNTIAAALAAAINADPDVSATASGATISLSPKFGCFTLTADFDTSLPNYFNPSFTATATPPVCP